MTPWPNPLASCWAYRGESPVAVMATMLLCATGSALALFLMLVTLSVSLRSDLTREATSRLTISRAAVSTSRVGSLEVLMSGRPLVAGSSEGAGVTSMSVAASYCLSASRTYATAAAVVSRVTATMSLIRSRIVLT